MTTASLEAYQNIVDKLSGKRAIVFESIKGEWIIGYSGRTINELCEALGWPYNTTSARVCELTDRGLIKENGMRKGQTVWIPSEPEEVDGLKRRRAEEKAKAKTAQFRQLQDELFKVRNAAAFLAGYAASVRQDGTPNQPEWVAGLLERVENVQKILGIDG